MTDHTVADLGEHAIIEKVRSRVPAVSAEVKLGIGDDAAILQPDRNTLTVVTTDVLVEGVHFDRAFTPTDAVGHKALAISLSDVAAMGGVPRHALISLALPQSLLVSDLDLLLDGLLGLGRTHRVDVVGGNVTRSPHSLFVEVTLMGSVKPRRILTRQGARPGDDLYVSGEIGGAAAGLASLRTGSEEEPCPDSRERFLRPQPRVRLGTQLGRNRAARACIDLSDGLADGVRQLAAASAVGAVLDAELLPIAAEVTRYFEASGTDPIAAAVAGGEDYELLFAAPRSFGRRIAAARRHAGGVPVTRIGQITKDPALVLRRGERDEPLPEGFEHFRENTEGRIEPEASGSS